MKIELVSYTPDPMQTIERAAAVCYDSEPTEDGKIMKACYRNWHYSVLEHANFTFHIEGVSRALLAQLTRHRVGVAFSVRSQRYCEEDNFNYVIPHTIANNDKAEQLYVKCMKDLSDIYAQLVDAGVPKEDARFVLPNACCTELTLTMNLRELIHFCNERLCTRAQWEIRELALAMKKAVTNVFPDATLMLVPKCEKNARYPFCPETQCCGRHPKLKDIYKEVEQ